jgi:hypothetical protein
MKNGFLWKGIGMLLLVVLCRTHVGAQILDLDLQLKDLSSCIADTTIYWANV